MTFHQEFWQALEDLLLTSVLVIDRPKGTCHPRFPGLVYPVDYGYLKDTSSMDGEGIDVFIGSEEERLPDAILCSVDLLKRDCEIKLLIGCTEWEKDTVMQFQNQSSSCKAILISK